MRQLTKLLNILRRPALVTLLVLMITSLSRTFLIVMHWDRVSATDGWWFILLQGFRFDIILIGMLFGPVFLLKPWFHTSPGLRRVGNRIIPAYMGLATASAFFIEAATPSFMNVFAARPNYLFVEYLGHPREVFQTLLASHAFELIALSVIAAVLVGVVVPWLRRDPWSDQQTQAGFCLLTSPFIVVAVFLMIRSTLDHRPVNPSMAAFSPDPLVNQLSLNSPYSLLYAVYEQHRDSRGGDIRYGPMDEQEAMKIVLEEAGLDHTDAIDPRAPTLHHHKSTIEREKPLNLVIVVEESLGAELVGSLGGEDLTPELDSLAEEGIWFEQLYATGTRSVRGIEALVTGFTPTPRLSVVKLAETQTDFFTIASLLERNGYRSSFLYGGSAHFDNMRRFFLNNGFQTIIEQRDFEDPAWTGAWGVSDEDLFERAHREFSNAGEQPFFSLVFTTTHHEPFDVPEDRVEPATGENAAKHTAVRYADYSLGRFMERARQSEYWENTVFLITADHSSRDFDDQLVPVNRFHVPGLIMGGQVAPGRIAGVSSLIDLLPTLLSLAGVSGDLPAIGRDLTRPEFAGGAGRAIMQYHRIQAYMEDDRVVVLQPDLEPQSFRRIAFDELAPDPSPDPDLVRKALAHAHFGPLMIQRNAYR